MIQDCYIKLFLVGLYVKIVYDYYYVFKFCNGSFMLQKQFYKFDGIFILKYIIF